MSMNVSVVGVAAISCLGSTTMKLTMQRTALLVKLGVLHAFQFNGA